MEENQKRREPKKIRMPPLVDRYKEYDTIYGDAQEPTNTNENHRENNSESISELESL